MNQAVQGAVVAHYYAPRRSHLSSPVVVAGPVFALVVPVVYTTETQPPESALHPHGHDHPIIAEGTVVLLVLVVVAIAGWRWFIGWLPLRQ